MRIPNLFTSWAFFTFLPSFLFPFSFFPFLVFRPSRRRSSSRPSVFYSSLFLLLSSLFLSSLFSPRAAEGAEFKLIPSLGLQEEYNDNIFYVDTEKVDDFITTVTPGLELVTRTERVDLNLLARIPVLRYIDTRDLNHIDQNYLGRLRYFPALNWSLSGEAGYVEDSRPDRDLVVTGLVTKAVIRRRQNYGAGIDHNFSERTKVGLSYSYSEEKYPDPEFADLKEHDARLTYIQDLGGTFPNVAARLNLGYSRYEYESPIIDYFYGTIGMSWALEEKWSLFLDGGASYVLSQFGPDADRQRESGTGWVGMAGFVYKGEKTDGNLTFSHRIEPASGTVGVTTRTSFGVEISRRFTYEFSGGLSVGYIINKADEGKFSTFAFNERFFYVNPRLGYEFTRDVALEASYHFAYTKDKLNNTEPRRSLAMLRFYIQHAFFE